MITVQVINKSSNGLTGDSLIGMCQFSLKPLLEDQFKHDELFEITVPSTKGNQPAKSG